MAAGRDAMAPPGVARASRWRDKGLHAIRPGDSVVLELPGGGGFGDPRQRDRQRLEADLQSGVVSPAGARADYGWQE